MKNSVVFNNIKNLIYIICFSILSLGEPNNDSPLNTQAATLWSNQGAYKRLLHEKYDAEAKKSSS